MAEAAAVGKEHHARTPRPGPFQPGPTPQQAVVQPVAVMRHTTIPRLLVSFAPITGVMGIAFVIMLLQRDYLTKSAGFNASSEQVAGYELDPTMMNWAVGIAFLVFALPIFAWGWWVVAATLNAQAKTRKAGWPWMLPMAVLVAVAALVAATVVAEGPRTILYIVFAVAYVWGAYGVLFSLRKSARAIKAEPALWTRLICIPWLSALSLFGSFMLAANTGSREIAVFGALVPLGLWLWAWLTICQAMASFDHACRAVEASLGDADGLPSFMTGHRAVR